MQPFLLLIALQPAAQATSGSTDLGAWQPPIVPQLRGCLPDAVGEDIVVCGRRGGERYRIPEALREQEEPGRPLPGGARASIEAAPFAPCGLFAGQRQCNKAEAARFGYGNGRDPLTVAGKIIAEIVDPD